MSRTQTVFVVDDDAGMRKSIGLLLRSAGLEFEAFASARAFLEAYDPDRSGCLILDIRMPEMSGLELQEQLLARGFAMPVIVVSGHASVATAVRAMKLGSFDFIEKPYSPHAILERVREALGRDLERRSERLERHSFRERLAHLTERERQVLALVVAGKPSKAIADQLGLTVSTVDNHRAKIMKKLQAGTAAELTRIVLTADPALAGAR